jgi:DNA-binding NtrC family response regulator
MATLDMTVLSVGIRNKNKALETLPVRVLVMDNGAEAVRHLFEDKIDIVISHWDLTDMPQGMLLEKIIAAKPNMPTVAFIEPGNWEQEITARSLGVTAILSEDIDESYFRNTICQILHIEDVSMLSLCGTKLGI